MHHFQCAYATGRSDAEGRRLLPRSFATDASSNRESPKLRVTISGPTTAPTTARNRQESWPHQTPEARVRIPGVIAFFVATFGLAWSPFLPVLFGGRPTALVLMPVAPALGCFIVRRWVTH